MESIPKLLQLESDKQTDPAKGTNFPGEISSLPHMRQVLRRVMAKARRDCMRLAQIQTEKGRHIGLNSFSVFDVMNQQEVDQFCAGIAERRDKQGKLQMRQYWRTFAWDPNGKGVKVLIGQ